MGRVEKMENNSDTVSSFCSHSVASVYFRKGYDQKGQFSSYWHQINETFSRNPESVLEIGVGTGFVARYLKRYGLQVTTLDIERALEPEIAGSVLSSPFKGNSFEVVNCCEVLEHLPYEHFESALREIHRVCNKHVILSLPQEVRRSYRVLIDIPRFKSIRKIISLPDSRQPVSPRCSGHCWEIGMRGFPLKRIIADIAKVGFEIENSYRVFEKLYHRFFVLKKMSRL
jgi:SAM-dependent methyltransferase